MNHLKLIDSNILQLNITLQSWNLKKKLFDFRNRNMFQIRWSFKSLIQTISRNFINSSDFVKFIIKLFKRNVFDLNNVKIAIHDLVSSLKIKLGIMQFVSKYFHHLIKLCKLVLFFWCFELTVRTFSFWFIRWNTVGRFNPTKFKLRRFDDR